MKFLFQSFVAIQLAILPFTPEYQTILGGYFSAKRIRWQIWFAKFVWKIFCWAKNLIFLSLQA